jgi:outer membrane protein
MHKKTYLSTGIIIASLGLSGAALAETLDEALISAYTSNTTLQSQRARVRANDELVPQALSNWRPTVKISGDAGRAKISSNSLFPTNQTTSPRDVGLTITEPLYRGGRTVAQTKQAEATVQSERALLAATEETVLLNAVTAYVNVVQGVAVVDLNKNQEQVLQRQLDATNDRFRVGEVTRTDVAQAESRLSAAHADRIQSEGDLQAAVANYVSMVGHAPANTMAPNTAIGVPPSVGDAKALALDQNPNILAAQYIYDAAAYGIDLVAGELLPQVSLNGNASHSVDSSFATSYSRVYEGSINVTVPIYQQGQEYSRLRQQKHIAGQRRIELDSTRRDTVESVARAWEALQTARARTTSYADQIRAAEVALEGVRRESQVGSRTVLDVLNQEQELLVARVNLVRAQHDEAVGVYQLKSSVGQLTAQALALPVEIYDPVKHYDEVRDQWIGTAITPAYGDEVK